MGGSNTKLIHAVTLLACALGVALGVPEAASAQVGSAVVRGVVFDSTEMKPLEGARVAVLGTNAVGATDSEGRFELTEVPAGTWWVSFYHNRLQALGVSAPSRQLTIQDRGRLDLDLSIPSEGTLLMGWCMAEQPGKGFAAVAGVVVDSLTGVPMPSAVVRAQVTDRQGNAEPVVVRTDEAGYYRMCSLPAGRDIRLQASFGMSNGRSEFLTTPERGATIRDLKLLMSAEGTLVGKVLDYQTGQPIAGAEVSVIGSPTKVLSDPEGKFIMDDLPPGRHLVVTEGLGYETHTDSITVFSQETVDVELRLSTEALEVEGLTVTARSRFGEVKSLAGQAKRGDFITRAAIEPLLTRVSHAGDLLRLMNVPGLSIREIRVLDIGGIVVPGLCVEVSRRFGGEGCMQAALYLNDVHMPYPDQVLQDLDANIIERIEILSPIDAQFQFGTVAGNGAIAIYTR